MPLAANINAACAAHHGPRSSDTFAPTRTAARGEDSFTRESMHWAQWIAGGQCKIACFSSWAVNVVRARTWRRLPAPAETKPGTSAWPLGMRRLRRPYATAPQAAEAFDSLIDAALRRLGDADSPERVLDVLEGQEFRQAPDSNGAPRERCAHLGPRRVQGDRQRHRDPRRSTRGERLCATHKAAGWPASRRRQRFSSVSQRFICVSQRFIRLSSDRGCLPTHVSSFVSFRWFRYVVWFC